MGNLVNIRTFAERYEAELAKGLLAEGCIESIISAGDCGGYRPHLPLGIGGIQLLIVTTVQNNLKLKKLSL